METRTKTYPDLVVVWHRNASKSAPEEGLTRRVLACNETLLLAEHEMEKGWSGKIHSHSQDQIAYVVHGHLRVNCQGKNFDVRTGDSFVVRGGVEHGASALEDSLVIDVFTPCRADFLG